jgi:hypothetical protein
MNWLFEYLSGILDAFTPEDQILLKAYWTGINNGLLSYHQQVAEQDLDATLMYALPTNKSFYVALVPEYIEQTYIVDSLPFKMPRGVKSFKAYGPTTYSTALVTLPIDMGEDVTVVNVTGNTRIVMDGSKILGTGTATVESRTSLIASPVIAGEYLTGPSSITSIVCEKLTADVPVVSGTAEVLVDGNIYDANNIFTSIPIGTIFTLWSADFTLEEVIDDHTIKFTVAVPGSGRNLPYKHQGFGYAIETTVHDIPTFDNGWESGKDYVIQDGVIAFAALPPDTLIAPVVYSVNYEVSNLFGKLLNLVVADGDNPETYLRDLQAMWYGIWNGSKHESIEFTYHALLGLPHTRQSDGVMTMGTISGSNTDMKEVVDLTIDKFNAVTVDDEEDYFTVHDRCIRFTNGGYAKIVKYITPQRVIIDGYAPVGSITGQASTLTAGTFVVVNRFGVATTHTLPPLSVPYFAPGDTIPIWSRLCTGVRIVDARGRNVKISDPTFQSEFCIEDPDAYLTDEYVDLGSDERAAQISRSQMLRTNVFLLEFDYCAVPLDLSFIRRSRIGSTQVQTVERASRIGIFDTVVIS